MARIFNELKSHPQFLAHDVGEVLVVAMAAAGVSSFMVMVTAGTSLFVMMVVALEVGAE